MIDVEPTVALGNVKRVSLGASTLPAKVPLAQSSPLRICSTWPRFICICPQAEEELLRQGMSVPLPNESQCGIVRDSELRCLETFDMNAAARKIVALTYDGEEVRIHGNGKLA